MVPVRAAENNVYIFYTNRVGWENATSPNLLMLGKSVVANPVGEIISVLSSDKEELAHVVVDSSLCAGQADWSYLDDRRSSSYMKMCEESHSISKSGFLNYLLVMCFSLILCF